VSERGGSVGAERIRQLLMKALDGELPAGEREELERLIKADSALEKEWNRLVRVKEVTEAMALRPAPDQVWLDYWASVYSRLERGIGWILVSLGAIVLISYGSWMGVKELIEDATLPWFIKASILALTIGAVVLLVSVAREKIFVGRRQRYKDVEI
jgi:ferric-dicitrate binding protein FerR (iron transport regulator)